MQELEDIVRGESKNVEFKVQLPDKSDRYMKSIVAFANTQGGKLIIGVDDVTRAVVGVDPSGLFDTMDRIATAIGDSCEPDIVPDIEPKTIDGKTIIVVSVEPGSHRPYYIKAKGRDSGTYIRVGATSRPATLDSIRELEREGSHISWDELPCIGYKVSNEEIVHLCEVIRSYRKDANLPDRKVDISQLINWRLLKEDGNGYVASNAFVLLAADHFPFAKVQCAVFKGTDRVVFVDKKEYTGPVYEQFEESVKFVKRNIRLSATITPTVRKENYELPMKAVREMILNALCHRDYTDDSCVQVAIYDDRLEVTSPGTLYFGLTYEEMMNGRSRLRNRVLANVFSQMGLIESWGTGIKRIISEAKAAGLRDPEFIEYDSMFRVNLYRKETADTFPIKKNLDGPQTDSQDTVQDTDQVTSQDSNHVSDQVVPSESEDRTERLLKFCMLPRSRKEIQDFLGLENRGYVRDEIIKPLIASGRLEMTIPDKPSSSKQRYITVKNKR